MKNQTIEVKVYSDATIDKKNITGKLEHTVCVGNVKNYQFWLQHLINKVYRSEINTIDKLKFKHKDFIELVKLTELEDKAVLRNDKANKLYKDFKRNCRILHATDAYFQTKYFMWMKCFELATNNNGIVVVSF